MNCINYTVIMRTRWKHTDVRVKVPPHQNSFILIIKKANTIPFQNNVINKKVTVQT